MDYINKIELLGNVGQVRTNTLDAGTVQNFSLYTQKVSQRADGTPICEGTWHNVVAWDKEKVKQGDVVHVKGRLRVCKYTSSDGTERTYPEVIVSDISIIDSRIEA